MPVINYTQADLKQIAAIDTNNHIGLLTNCGTSPDIARKIIATDTDTPAKAIAATEGHPNKSPAMAAVIAASRRELLIRQ